MRKHVKYFWYALPLAILLLDQFTKHYASIKLIPYHPYPVIPILNFTLVYNTGAAFSFLVGTGAWHYWFLLIFSMVMSIILSIWLYKAQNKWQALAIALVLGGALGNLYDRLSLSYVIDFIDVYYSIYHWPVFNVADSAICVGAILLFFVIC